MSNYIIPFLVIIIIIYAFIKKVDVYNEFVSGAKESFDMIFTMFPCILAMIFGVNIFINSGIVNIFYKFAKPLFELLRIPIEVFPMMIMRPISGTSSLAILNNIFNIYGPDSFVGRLASIIQGSTDTTFYVITLYFGSVGIKKIRYALWAGLFADLAGITAAVIITHFLFG